MKNLYLILLLSISLTSVGQQAHIITANDHFFDPDTTYINVGDTVRLVSNGYHSITELDSLDWVNDQATSNSGFWIGVGASVSDDWFVVNQSGKYFYNCNPHADMGMKGVLYVGASQSVQEEVKPEKITVYLDGENNIRFNKTNAEKVLVYSITGKKVHAQLLNGTNKIDDLNLNAGLYLISFVSNDEVLTTQKFIIK